MCCVTNVQQAQKDIVKMFTNVFIKTKHKMFQNPFDADTIAVQLLMFNKKGKHFLHSTFKRVLKHFWIAKSQLKYLAFFLSHY